MFVKKFRAKRKFIKNFVKAIDVIAKMKDRYLGIRSFKNPELTRSKISSIPLDTLTNKSSQKSLTASIAGITESVLSDMPKKTTRYCPKILQNVVQIKLLVLGFVDENKTANLKNQKILKNVAS